MICTWLSNIFPALGGQIPSKLKCRPASKVNVRRGCTVTWSQHETIAEAPGPKISTVRYLRWISWKYMRIYHQNLFYLLLHFCYTKPCCSERWDWTHSACNNIETAIWSLKCLAQRWIHISKWKKPSRAILCSLYLVRGWGDQNGCREIPSKPTW